MTPLDQALCAGVWSTDYTRLVLLVAEEVHAKRGRVDAAELHARVGQGLAAARRRRAAFDARFGLDKHGAAPVLRGDAEPANKSTMAGFDARCWEIISNDLPFNTSAAWEEVRAHRARLARRRRAEAEFDAGASYVTPENVHPNGDPYPDSVPVGARAWCTYSSMEWLHPDFEGQVVRDDSSDDVWPLKQDWHRTTEFPEGLWEVNDPRATKNLTASEAARAAAGYRARLAQVCI